MAAKQRTYSANSPTLKRSFTAVASSTPPSPETAAPGVFKVSVPSRLQGDQYTTFFPKRRMSSDHQSPSMPVAAGPQAYQSHFPTFMTVYGLDQSSMDESGVAAPITKLEAVGDSESPLSPKNDQTQHQHRDSTSTQASESTDSSPTTTISTADSSSLTDPSPSSSPESPVTIIPLSSFSATSFGVHSLDDLTMSDHTIDQHPLGSISYDRPMTSPSPRKPRNAKGLALKLPGIGDPQQTSAPASPSFIKPPIPKPKKKPSLLSLQTSANPNLNPIARLTIEPPPTPGFRGLKHSHSSPAISLFSPNPRGGPEGGMQLPALQRSKVSGLSTTFRKPAALKESTLGAPIDEEESPIKTQMATRSQGDIGGDPFDAPASQEDAQSPGYPHGPVEIYSPNVFLYLEPTAEEASRFDVIMNVAREVKNPFKVSISEPAKSPAPKTSFDPMEVDREYIPVPDTAASNQTFQTAFEYPIDLQQTPTESSPTTPKPNSKPEPEYFHIPWDHNTDISKDLMDLCETIEARTKEGKRVLVHCQQGASRSASLIIAYGIYTNPTLSVNDAYHAAQAKSKWISPNMKLMYALQDFQKEVERKKLLSVNSAKGGRHLDRRASPTKHRTTMSADAVESSPREPQTAPLPSENDMQTNAGGLGPSAGHTPVRPSSTPDFGAISPGPSSAPSSYAWTPKGTPGAENEMSPRSDFTGLWNSDRKINNESTSPSQLQLPQQVLRPSASFTGFSNSPTSFKDLSCSYDGTLTPPHTGFGSHRKEHKLTIPSLTLTPKDSGNSSSSSSSTATLTLTSTTTPRAGDDIKPQFVSLPAPSNGAIPQTPSLWSPRIQEMTAHPLRPIPQPAAQATNAYVSGQYVAMDIDTPPTPNIMSPKATEFTITAFARPSLPGPSLSYGSQSNGNFSFAPYASQAHGHGGTAIPNFSRPRPFGATSPPRAPAMGGLGGLASPGFDSANGSAREVAGNMGFATPEKLTGSGFGGFSAVRKEITPPKKVDPRSPAIGGEAIGILRSIDDVL